MEVKWIDCSDACRLIYDPLRTFLSFILSKCPFTVLAADCTMLPVFAKGDVGELGVQPLLKLPVRAHKPFPDSK